MTELGHCLHCVLSDCMTGSRGMGRASSVGIAVPTVQGSNPGGGQIFRTRPDRPWVPPSFLYEYSGYQVSFPGVKRPGRGVDHPPHLAPRLKKE